MTTSSFSEPKIEIPRLAGSKGKKRRRLILNDDSPEEKERVGEEVIRQEAIRVLNSADHDAIQQLITNLESSSFNRRLYMFCKSNYPNTLSLKLLHLFLNSPNNPDVKSSCAGLLRLLLDSPCFWSSALDVIRDDFKIMILEILKYYNPEGICKQMWKMASRIFTNIIINKQGEWQDMLSFFCKSLNSDTLYVQDCAVMFFLELPTCLGQELSQYVQDLRLNFWNKFNSSNGERKVHALAALVNLVRHMSSEYYSHFRDLLMPMLKAVSDFLDNDVTEENAQTSLMKLAELSGEEPRFFDSDLNKVFDAMVKIALNDKLEEQTTYLTVKMMYVFDDIAIKRVNKRVLGRLCHVLIRMISLIPDKSGNYLLGEKFLQRIAMLRGEKLRMPLLLEIIPEDMASSDWRKRYAVVTIIGVFAKGCGKAMCDNLGEVMKVVTKSMNDPSPSVLFAAIRTINTMSLELPPHTLDQHAKFLIIWLHLALADGGNPFKQAAAVSAMRSLCERCSLCIIEPLLETCVSKLLELVQSERAEVQTESLNALASFARLSKDTYCKCRHLVITFLKKHLAGATSKSLQERSFECIWTVAMAFRKDIFKKDTTEVVALLLSMRWYLGEDDHSLKVDLLQAWEQLLIRLRSHFYPYVNDLMPELLRSARLGSNSATERVILTEKLNACKLILRLIKEFKEELFPWIDQVSDILVSLVKFHDGDIRKIALSAMPKLLLSTKLSIENKQSHGVTNSYLHKLVLRFMSSLLEAVDEETDSEICAKIVKSLTKCIEIGGGFLSKKKIQHTADAIEMVLKAVARKHFSEEDDVTDLEKKIIGKVVNFIRVLVKIYDKNSFIFIDKFLACIKSLRRDEAKEKETAMVTLCEVFVKCKRAAFRY